MLINSCAGRWSLLLTGLISARNNARRGTAKTGITNVIWGGDLLSSFGSFLTLTTTNCQHSVHLSEKVLHAVYI